MASERIMTRSPLDEKLRGFALQLLRDGYTMDAIITALQELKVELSMAAKYHQATTESAFKP